MDKELIRSALRNMPLSKPQGELEWVDVCDFSRTGYAIWRHGSEITGDYCTCQPAAAPEAANKATPP